MERKSQFNSAEEAYSRTPDEFNPLAYLIRNPDVCRKKVNPFEHYVKHGATEKRQFSFANGGQQVHLVCIMKSEESYLLEWIAHHRNEGFTSIIIGDNGGSDEQTKILSNLHNLGLIRRIDLLGRDRAQIEFYNDILVEFQGKTGIVGFIDTDEFVWSNSENLPAAHLIADVFSDPQVGALGINWAVYGSNNQLTTSGALVQKRFSKRAVQDFGPNLHIKSFVRCGSALQFAGTPHAVVLKDAFRYVSSDRSELNWGPKGAGISQSVVWGSVRLNHYIVKSRAEYDIRKMRGSATSETNDHVKKSTTYFKQFDKNDIEDGMAETRLEALEAEFRFLTFLVKKDSESEIGRVSKPQLTFSPEVTSFLTACYTSATTILEYGSGGSTALAADLPGKTVFSVESDRDWVAMMQRWFRQESTRGKVHLQHVDIGPTKEWGYPKDESRRLHWIDYPLSVWERPDLIHPDVVLIDGRFRVGCFLATLMSIRRPTTILFDDYGDRPHYHVVEELLPPARHVGRMAIFEARPRALHPSELRRFGSYFFRPE